VILGCGVDLVEVARFEQEVARRGDGLVDELFTAGELAWCRRRRRRRAAEGLAMGYAAKEALFKAIGTGKVGRMAWSDIEVAWPAGAERPGVTLTGETAAEAERIGVTTVHLALASCLEFGIAWVVVAGRGSGPFPSVLG
jgi:holo-[acyl-carrier protein] synthase